MTHSVLIGFASKPNWMSPQIVLQPIIHILSKSIMDVYPALCHISSRQPVVSGAPAWLRINRSAFSCAACSQKRGLNFLEEVEQ